MDNEQQDKFWEISEAVEEGKEELAKLKGGLESILKETKKDFGTDSEDELNKTLNKKEKSLTRITNKLDTDFQKLEDAYDTINSRQN